MWNAINVDKIQPCGFIRKNNKNQGVCNESAVDIKTKAASFYEHSLQENKVIMASCQIRQ